MKWNDIYWIFQTFLTNQKLKNWASVVIICCNNLLFCPWARQLTHSSLGAKDVNVNPSTWVKWVKCRRHISVEGSQMYNWLDIPLSPFHLITQTGNNSQRTYKPASFLWGLHLLPHGQLLFLGFPMFGLSPHLNLFFKESLLTNATFSMASCCLLQG